MYAMCHEKIIYDETKHGFISGHTCTCTCTCTCKYYYLKLHDSHKYFVKSMFSFCQE